MFQRVLVANRGEIALRVIRTLKEMGLTSLAMYSEADRDALFVRQADEAFYLGPTPAGESYLNIPAILEVARVARAEAVHPGYGFLAENAPFARAVQNAGLTFIGPSPRAIRLMGDKVEARKLAGALGVPLVPGTPGPVGSLDQALQFASEAGYPVAVKAAGGGGGRGIRVVRTPEEMPEALATARREAEAYFKNPEVYLERYFDDPKHIEIQVLGDRLGHLVHLGERDCSVQRRHQKLIEEAPSPVVDRDLRARIGEAALQAARSVGYDSAGTVEFLLTHEREFYFLEMNTRIQVEHGVTERVTGVDLIREMTLAAGGEPITVQHDILDLNGHAIEIRINAEDPAAGFRPTPGLVSTYLEPGGIGIRVDSGVYPGYTIPGAYDSLIAKLIAWGPDREQARRRTLRALGEFRVGGVATTIPFAEAVLRNPEFIAGTHGTTFIGRNQSTLEAALPPADPAPAALTETTRGEEREFEVEVNRQRFTVKVAERQRTVPERGKKRRTSHAGPAASANVIVSPMHGTVLAIKKEAGQTVEAGETVFVIEAMKMENEVTAPHAGTIASMAAEAGQTVEADEVLATLE